MSMEEKVEVLFSSNGENKIQKLTLREIEEISSDPQKYDDIIQKLFGENCEPEPHSENIPDEQIGECAGGGARPSSAIVKWNSDVVKLLINIRLNMEESFNRPSCKKSKLWENVAEKIRTVNKCIVTGDDCNIKYRNLLHTYRLNKQKRLKATGESKITWEYFDIFDEVLGTKASTIPPSNILSTSISDIDSDKLGEDTFVETSCSKDSENSSHSTESQVRRKNYKKNESTLSKYIDYRKNVKEKEAEKEEKRWEEKKKLKLQEIKAINNLADAIKLAATDKTTKRRRESSDSD